MEITEGAVGQNREGISAAEPVASNSGQEREAVSADVQPTQLVPTIPPEQLDKDGNPPNITPALVRKLRGKYFTVKHPLLLDCNHRLDMVNFPKRNCHTCLFNWFNSHAQLVELAHEFLTKHGKKPLIAMRGEKFVKAFLMFMSTIAHFQKEAASESSHKEKPITSGIAPAETRTSHTDASPTPIIEGRETQGGSRSD